MDSVSMILWDIFRQKVVLTKFFWSIPLVVTFL